MCGALDAADGSIIPDARGTDDIRLILGVAPPIESGMIRDIDVDSAPAPFTQSLKASAEIGPKGGLRYLHGFWFDPTVGIKVGLDGVAMRSAANTMDSTASSTDEFNSFSLKTVAMGLWAGPTFRISIEGLDYPADFCEVEFLVGGGPALATATNDSATSEVGNGWRYGGSAALIFTTFSRWQAGLEIGYEVVEITGLRWSNTGASEVTATGISGGLVIGRRW